MAKAAKTTSKKASARRSSGGARARLERSTKELLRQNARARRQVKIEAASIPGLDIGVLSIDPPRVETNNARNAAEVAEYKLRQRLAESALAKLDGGGTTTTASPPAPSHRVVGPGDFVLVRSYDAGIVAGVLARISPDATRVDLVDARHCWSWAGGRLTIEDVARVGASSGDKWSGKVAALTQADVCSTVLCTPEAQKSIEAAPIAVK